jgi:cell division protein FtsB
LTESASFCSSQGIGFQQKTTAELQQKTEEVEQLRARVNSLEQRLAALEQFIRMNAKQPGANQPQ